MKLGVKELKKSGTYTEEKIPKLRKILIENVERGLHYTQMDGLVEIDVTKALALLKKHEKKTGEKLSFTGWIVKCVSQAVSENKKAHAKKKGQKLIIFDDIDISVLVEKTVEGDKIMPLLFVIRKTNEKSIKEIHEEIRAAQVISEEDYENIDSNKQAILLNQLPKFLRRIFFWKRFEKNPFFRKKYAGTILVSTIGTAGKRISGWAMHPTSHSPVFTIGSIKEKPCVVNKRIVIRDILFLSLMIDHSVIDGAPAVRFVSRLIEIIENATGLESL